MPFRHYDVQDSNYLIKYPAVLGSISFEIDGSMNNEVRKLSVASIMKRRPYLKLNWEIQLSIYVGNFEMLIILRFLNNFWGTLRPNNNNPRDFFLSKCSNKPRSLQLLIELYL